MCFTCTDTNKNIWNSYGSLIRVWPLSIVIVDEFHTHTVPCINTKTNSRTATQTNSPTEIDTTLPIRTEEYTERKIIFTTFTFFCLYFIISTNFVLSIGTNFVFNTKEPKNNECNFSFYNSILTTFNKKFLDINFVQGLGTIAKGRNETCVRDDIYSLCSSTKNSIYVAPYSGNWKIPKTSKIEPKFSHGKNYPSSNLLSFSDHSGPLAGKKIAL